MAGLISNEKYSLYFQKVGLLYKRPEVRASLEVILSVFTITILIFVAIRPTLTNIATLQKKIEDQEIVNKKADNKIVQLLSAENQLKTFQNSLILFDAAVPDNFSYVDSARRLEYLAKSNNLTLDSLSLSGITLLGNGKIKGDWANKIMQPTGNNTLLDPVLFTVSGKPQNIITFLKEIENMDRLVGLNNVSLAKQVGLTNIEDSLKATGQMTFYFYTEKQ